MKQRWTSALCITLLTLVAAGANAGALSIDHNPIECIIHDTFPMVSAGFAPLAEADAGRVYFRAAGTEDWYYVEMEGPNAPWAAVLPKPAPGLEGIDYFVLGMDLAGSDSETPKYHPIVSTKTYCENEALTVTESADTDKISLVIGILRYGQKALPDGFLADGIKSVIMPDGLMKSFEQASAAGGTSATGATASTAGTAGTAGTAAGAGGGAAAAAAGGGLGGGAITGIVLGTLAVGGGAYYALDEDDESSSSGGVPDTISGSWHFVNKCISQTDPNIEFDVNFNSSAGSFYGTGSGTDYGGTLMELTFEGTYSSSSHYLECTITYEFPDYPGNTRIDSFTTTLTSNDTGWVNTACHQGCNCAHEVRLYEN